ncbi:flagellar protein FlaG [Photobacterium galatheae]|uniref:Flagellar protein FlaG n=1 Tax=Photobacterium galatheae TaxID=1654360 RepID=A0A066RRR1_9GAMM|nr:flagellar protein FlaG [Photobacterium galatheae]KDM93044.1 flagellar protein FlaG [Photobacterium galatheae]MCM0148427.1 flagellar protein FlaG [Photobacterium galatheae]
MDVKSVLNPSFLSRFSSSGTKSTVGTDVAKPSTGQSQDNSLTVQAQSPSATNASSPSDVRRVEQTAKLEEHRQLQRQQLEKLVESIEDFIGSMNKGLAFRIDEESGRQVVTVYEKESGEVVRQIPDEDMLVLSRQIASYTTGLLTTKV